ncbi:MAG: hypothetical protein ABF297_07470, partial [Thiogranum sp.]
MGQYQWRGTLDSCCLNPDTEISSPGKIPLAAGFFLGLSESIGSFSGRGRLPNEFVSDSAFFNFHLRTEPSRGGMNRHKVSFTYLSQEDL